ncbi:MAG TPA: FAD-dependent oxidoreductase [Thermodesulfobacteriota bacterium]|nr:FAD-dependent oxidoreductase [Thermodesulfobacteriota bacterium]
MKHVIIGSGPAGIFAAEAIRRIDAGSPILMVSEDEETARSPVMLTHWIGGEVRRESLRFRDESWAEKNQVELRPQTRVAGVQSAARRITLSTGDELPFDRLLIASGSSPLSLPIPGVALEGVHAVRTISDGELILRRIPNLHSCVIIGGGFIGLKMAGHLRESGVKVTILEKEDRLAPRMFDAEASQFIRELLSGNGIRVETGVEAAEILGEGGRVSGVKLKDGRVFAAEMVIQSLGITPRTEFLASSGISVERGIPVNSSMETNIAGIYAAGDVAITLDSLTGQKINNATWPAASRQGTVAGTNMAGGSAVFVHNVPLNAFVLCGVPVMAAGDSGESTGEVVREQGTGFYRKAALRDGCLTGFILIGRVSQAGALLSAMKRKDKLSAADLAKDVSLRERRLPRGLGYHHGI